MTRPNDEQEDMRKSALTAFLDARVAEGFRVETRTDTHAIIAQGHQRWWAFRRLRGPKASARQVISVDQHGDVTMVPAEPLRS